MEEQFLLKLRCCWRSSRICEFFEYFKTWSLDMLTCDQFDVRYGKRKNNFVERIYNCVQFETFQQFAKQ